MGKLIDIRKDHNKFLINDFLLYTAVLFIGAVVFFHFYPNQFIFSDDIGFYTGDTAQQVSGFYAFRDTTWHFPIFWTNRLNYPDGLSIIGTDSIPIVALLIKPFVSLLPPNFHYFKIWYFFSFMFQAVGGAYLIRQMRRKRIIDGIIAAIFAVITPCFIMRANHSSLMAQGIILLALGLYFKENSINHDTREPSQHWYIFEVFLICVSFLIHAYLTAMIVPIYWAAVLDRKGNRTNFWRKIIECTYPIISLVIVYFVFWYYPNSQLAIGEPGYGTYSMNLFAPFVGGSLIHWGKAFKPISTAQAFEGMNYLGLGVIALFFLATISNFVKLKLIINRYRYLIIVLLLFSVFALSNKIYAGKTLLWEYPESLSQLASILGERFRSTGRFFWPVGYSIAFSSLSAILSIKRKYIVWIVLSLLVVQWLDIPKFDFNEFIQKDVESQKVFPPQIWDGLLSGKRELYVTPALSCGSRIKEITTLQLVATKNRVIINTAYSARNRTDCEKKQLEMLSRIEKETVHVYLNKAKSNPVTLEQVEQWVGSNTRDWCRSFIYGIVCIPNPDEDDMIILNNEYFSKIPEGD